MSSYLLGPHTVTTATKLLDFFFDIASSLSMSVWLA
jgi:hypothetical protein